MFTYSWVSPYVLDHALTLGRWTPNAVMKTLTTTTMKTNAVVMFSSRLSWKCLLSSLRFHFTVGKDKRDIPYFHNIIIMESSSNSFCWHIVKWTPGLSYALDSVLKWNTPLKATDVSKHLSVQTKLFVGPFFPICYFNNANKQQQMWGHFKCVFI